MNSRYDFPEIITDMPNISTAFSYEQKQSPQRRLAGIDICN